VRQLTFKNYLYKAHLYAGLLFGIFFLLIALTGSFLVFYPEIDLLLHPETKVQQSSLPAQSLQAVLNTLRTQYPALKKGWRIEMPMQSDLPIYARYMKPNPVSADDFAPLVVSINPYSLQVTSGRVWGEYMVTWVYNLHYQLLLGGEGKTLITLLGILLLVNVFLGLYLWFPKTKQAWRHALVYKLHAHPIRSNYDIHKLSGVYGLLLIIVLASTGALLGQANWFNPIINAFSKIDNTMPAPLHTFSSKRLSIDEVVAVAYVAFPNAELRWIYTPDTAADYYQVRLFQANEPGRRFPKTICWIDPYTGKIAQIKKPKAFSAGDTILAWLHPLHNGEAFGLLGRVLAFISGFIIAVLLWTGFKRAQYKWHVKRKTLR
jgi:uncharacterized iron-regulated membrane protein